jgi:hypothetical protein
MGGDKLGLAEAKAVRLIAAAHLGVFGLKGTDCVGGKGSGVCHAGLMSGWMGWLHRALGADVALKYDPSNPDRNLDSFTHKRIWNARPIRKRSLGH